MPTWSEGYSRPQPRTWRTMSRYWRREFHRENESRRIRGLPPLRKP